MRPSAYITNNKDWEKAVAIPLKVCEDPAPRFCGNMLAVKDSSENSVSGLLPIESSFIIPKLKNLSLSR